MQKSRAEAVSLDRDLRAQGGLDRDLISSVYYRSDGLGPSGAGAGALTAGDHSPQRRGTGNSPEMAIGVLRGSIWVAVWPGR